MIPKFLENGLLPAGIHSADWNELVQRFSWTEKREQLLVGLKAALIPLRDAGCQEVFINGSFTTSKDFPGDIDCAWNPDGVNLDQLRLLEPVFFEFANGRKSQKDKFGCEFFPASFAADGAGTTFIEFFQTDKATGEQKGIVCLSLKDFPGTAHHDDKE